MYLYLHSVSMFCIYLIAILVNHNHVNINKISLNIYL